MKRPLLILGLVTLVLATASCSAGGGSDGASDPGDRPTSTAASDPAGEQPGPDPDEVVWQEPTSGGFVPEAYAATEVPRVTIYADGRIFVQRAVRDGVAGHPAELEQGQIADDDLQAFLSSAEASGLFGGDVDFGTLGITDQATTSVSLRTAGRARTIDVYALGFALPTDNAESIGLTPEQVTRRAELTDLIATAHGLGGDREAYVPERIRATSFGPIEDTGQQGDPLPWPGPPFTRFPEPTDGGTSCLVIEGDDAQVVYNAALEAETTAWTDGSETRTVVVAPLLPGQEGCPPS
jgi:hypothetical protein